MTNTKKLQSDNDSLHRQLDNASKQCANLHRLHSSILTDLLHIRAYSGQGKNVAVSNALYQLIDRLSDVGWGIK